MTAAVNRLACWCAARPGVPFTAGQAAAALGVPEATAAGLLRLLTARCVNGSLDRDGDGYIFTPGTGPEVWCSQPDCCRDQPCAGCAELLAGPVAARSARYCAARPGGQVAHELTWEQLHAGPLVAVPCPEHAQPGHAFAQGGVLDLTGPETD